MEQSNLRRTLWVMFLGQAVSFSLALTSFSSSLVAALGVDAPIAQSCFSYFGLALVYGGIFLHRRHKLQVAWYWYLLLGFIDVQGNYLGTKSGSRPLLGDTLVIGGTIFFALSNVGEEFCVKRRDRIEVVMMLGVFGLLVSLVESFVFERESIKSLNWSVNIVLAIAGYTISIFSYYTLTPYVLKLSGATLFNLSILTSDMWAVLIRIFFYGQKVDWLYFLAFLIVTIGIVTYSVNEQDFSTNVPKINEGDDNSEYQLLDDDNTKVVENECVVP
ncbi:unnamed protein product [Linum tenue]|uniref:Uncharacterized protein n=1 Tax=Linum tenue TaxID=586396 RepID=A0AAV0KNH5_9ROSI|nr:unnamed protein product [Linum tenue]